MLLFQLENRTTGDILNLFTVCSSSKWKFIVCLLLYKEKNGSYLFAHLFFLLNRQTDLPINGHDPFRRAQKWDLKMQASSLLPGPTVVKTL
jgi:hypothetical protein